MTTRNGHVFVAHASLTALACDDVLVPTDAGLHFSPHWSKLLGDRMPRTLADLKIESGQWRGRRYALVPGTGVGEEPRVWVVDTGGTGRESLDWYLAPIRAVLTEIALGEDGVRRGRSRRLTALPLVGVGAGGMAGRRGEVIKALLAVLDERAASGQDVVLTMIKRRDYGAVQSVRRSVPSPLTDHREQVAADLAGKARRGELALFLGAGVSASAGLPLWKDLIRRLLAGAKVVGPEADSVIALNDPRDQATIAARELGTRGVSVAAALRVALSSSRYGLSHALMAALPVDEVVTTNYDDLFEAARGDQGGTPAVLPFDAPSKRWVLKLHGDLKHDSNIVLTREDYLRFGNSSAALAGVVQQMLLTKHLLFAGFSFTDENFFRLAHDARRTLEDAGWEEPRLVGTALELQGSAMRRRLWDGELNYLAMGDDRTSLPIAARELEIFLDRVACLASDDTSFFLDEAYASLRDESDAVLVEALGDIADLAWNGDGPGRAMIRQLLEQLGHSREERPSLTFGRVFPPIGPAMSLPPAPTEKEVAHSRHTFEVKKRASRATYRIMEAGRLADDTRLRIDPQHGLSLAEAKIVREWLDEQRDRRVAYWKNDSSGPILWAVDGQAYKPTSLANKLYSEATGRQPAACQGTTWFWVEAGATAQDGSPVPNLTGITLDKVVPPGGTDPLP